MPCPSFAFIKTYKNDRSLRSQFLSRKGRLLISKKGREIERNKEKKDESDRDIGG
jgi:hypothetical protein